ncbi:MAG TPA: hypothetical protein VLN74_03130 [Ilumatobacteraceae bacterium]|nr:hypothetical protein [Ilumatobacteraceae bacterium]
MTNARVIARLVGVYDADGTLRGEVEYWVGARLGRRHCSLCEITHGTFRRRPEWDAWRAGLPVRFDTYHRDDQPDAVREVAAGRCPVVVGETTDGGTVLLLGPDELEDCAGSGEQLVAAIERAATDAGFTWHSS